MLNVKKSQIAKSNLTVSFWCGVHYAGLTQLPAPRAIWIMAVGILQTLKTIVITKEKDVTSVLFCFCKVMEHTHKQPLHENGYFIQIGQQDPMRPVHYTRPCLCSQSGTILALNWIAALKLEDNKLKLLHFITNRQCTWPCCCFALILFCVKRLKYYLIYMKLHLICSKVTLSCTFLPSPDTYLNSIFRVGGFVDASFADGERAHSDVFFQDVAIAKEDVLPV